MSDNLLPNKEQIQISVHPNEYSNIYAFNRCLHKLYENDKTIYDNMIIHKNLELYNNEREYERGERVVYEGKIYVCTEQVSGEPPSETNTLPYYLSISEEYTGGTGGMCWAEDNINIDSVENGFGVSSLKEYNIAPIKALSSYSFGENASNISVSEDKISYGKDPPTWETPLTAFGNLSIEDSISSNNPDRLYILNDTYRSKSYESNVGCADYIISSVIETTELSSTWFNLYKSNWAETGCTKTIKKTSRDMTYGKSSHLIGVENYSNVVFSEEITLPVNIYGNVLFANATLGKITASNGEENDFDFQLQGKQIMINGNKLALYISGMLFDSSGNVLTEEPSNLEITFKADFEARCIISA